MGKRSLIYVGRCLPTNKVYVGSTKQGHRRVFSHLRDLDKSVHSNSYLQAAWAKYGSKAFKWYVVEECRTVELLAREQWWIEFLRAADRRYGFNLLFPVTGRAKGSELSKTQVEKWRDPEIRAKRLTGLKAAHKDPEWKAARGSAMAQRWQDPVWRAKMLKVLSGNVDNLQARMKNEPGFKQRRMRGIQPVK